MKYLLYFIFAITLLSCGGDDNSNDPQTFLEKYNDVTWIDDINSQVTFWYNFTTENYGDGEAFDNGNGIIDCGAHFLAWDTNYDLGGNDYLVYNLVENSSETLKVRYFEIDGAYTSEEFYTFTVFSDGDSLNIVSEYDGMSYSHNYVRDDTFPCP